MKKVIKMYWKNFNFSKHPSGGYVGERSHDSISGGSRW